MRTVVVQIKDDKAYKLLENLETQKVLKVMKANESSSQNLHEEYADTSSLDDEVDDQDAGKLPPQVAKEFEEYRTRIREEGETEAQKFANRFAGILPHDVADELRAHVAQGRGKVWKRSSI
ncbi:hypothetical protein EZS27_029659 [termite gut metagenome]|jgi:hypothetical protein|uniref:Uncharacterized protein n=1 Tax=termite gut metagenome TaxID=433724 RepID=A0A5J4QFN1_9ZZZZ